MSNFTIYKNLSRQKQQQILNNHTIYTLKFNIVILVHGQSLIANMVSWLSKNSEKQKQELFRAINEICKQSYNIILSRTHRFNKNKNLFSIGIFCKISNLCLAITGSYTGLFSTIDQNIVGILDHILTKFEQRWIIEKQTGTRNMWGSPRTPCESCFFFPSSLNSLHYY